MTPPPASRAGRLADGRAIWYFDDDLPRSVPPDPAPPDPRSISRVGSYAELRHDPLVDEWVIVATHRQDRVHLPSAEECPLCPSRPGQPTEIPAASYDVVVFENRFPSLPAGAPDRPPAGRAEVVVYAADHRASFADLPDDRLHTIGGAWAARIAALEAEAGIAHVMAFENRGEEIGVTLHHPHGQIYAFPVLPPRIERLLTVADAHRQRTGTCLGCAVLADEVSDGTRVVSETPHAVAYVPRAARWPYEVHVVPRRHVGSLSRLGPEELDDLVRSGADVLGRLDRLFGRRVPYMAGWLGAPARDPDRLHLRWQIVSPQRSAAKLKFLAGSESLAGAFINDVRPEDAAARLRATAGRVHGT
ncbi:MAG TPA: galactose-1-phosphate uridylyltransferase [Candidatus Limnocylindria bacterium]|nr:galactose-1-phosphate uridylyltransferase [Candidatus Limnocylindria bacterium]